MESDRTYTRSKVLKRVGIGAAAAWSVPFLASSASASTKGVDFPASGCHANGQTSCPDCGFCSFVCGTKNGFVCGCAPGAKGGKGSGCCVCVNNFFCSDAVPCNGNGDCPTGWKCGFNCCSSSPTCMPPCGVCGPSGCVSCGSSSSAFGKTAGG
jgi:hypothetical protein